MIETREGIVKEIIAMRPGLTEAWVESDGHTVKAVAYQQLTGPLEVGDRVIINRTATKLSLGSGGYDFIMVNLNRSECSLNGKGHIMKMRYTPWQCRVLSVEEEESPVRTELEKTQDLGGTPILAGTIHSMLAPLAACLAKLGLTVAYVMTDGACLPVSWSRTVEKLKNIDLIKGTVSAGNAWGGDLEAVNIFSGLLAARAVWKPDVIVVTMGPGIVGTGTKWGFSGVEQGVVLNAVDSLRGQPIAVPRISFADLRERHKGISHHSITVLKDVCRVRVAVPIPLLDMERTEYINNQVAEAGLKDLHDIVYRDGSGVGAALAEYGLKVTTMGRGENEDQEFFLALGAAATYAAECVRNNKNED
ncbi:MAG: DUF3866 family protein [Chitinophagales bacterium]